MGRNVQDNCIESAVVSWILIRNFADRVGIITPLVADIQAIHG